MWIRRSLILIIAISLVGVALNVVLGGRLWVWLLGAWILSGPLIVADAFLRKTPENRAMPRGSASRDKRH